MFPLNTPALQIFCPECHYCIFHIHYKLEAPINIKGFYMQIDYFYMLQSIPEVILRF